MLLSVTAFDFEIAWRTVWGEASGEAYEGQVAVAWVIKNRGKQSHFSLAQVCLRPYQFSAWNTDYKRRVAMASPALIVHSSGHEAQRAMAEALLGTKDPTHGSLHYHVIGIRPKWTEGKVPVVTIGNHMFYNDID